jgi:hypothetical protein
MKEVLFICLFICHVKISETVVPSCCALIGIVGLCNVGKPSMSSGALSWIPNVSTYGGELIEY